MEPPPPPPPRESRTAGPRRPGAGTLQLLSPPRGPLPSLQYVPCTIPWVVATRGLLARGQAAWGPRALGGLPVCSVCHSLARAETLSRAPHRRREGGGGREG